MKKRVNIMPSRAAFIALILIVFMHVFLYVIMGIGRMAFAYPSGWTLQRKVWSSDATSVSIEARGNYVWVVWRRSDNSIWLKRSTDKGASWEDSQCIENGSYANDNPVVISGSSTNCAVYVIWSGKRSGDGYYQTWIARSNDWGATFPSSNRWCSSGKSDKVHHSAARIPENKTVIFSWAETISGAKEICWGKIAVNGTITQGSARSSIDGVDSHRPVVAANGYGDILIVWQDEAGGSYSRPHLVCTRSVDGGSTWGAPGSGVLPYSNRYRQSYPSVVWDQNPVVVYRGQDIETGDYFVGRFILSMMGASWTPASVEKSIKHNTGVTPTFPKVIGSQLADIFYKNKYGRLSQHGSVDNFFGSLCPASHSRSLALASADVASQEDIHYACLLTSDGGIYLRRKDRVKPSFSITNPAFSGGPAYFNSDFVVNCNDAVDDFKVSGTDVSTGKIFVNGIERIAYFYSEDGVSYKELPCQGGSLSFEPPYSRTVDSSQVDGKKIKIRALCWDSAENEGECITSDWVFVDTKPPVTSLSLKGKKGKNGWFTSDVEVALSCGDFTFDRSEYRIEDLSSGRVVLDWQTYNKAVALSEGKWLFKYRSIDKCKNREKEKTARILIDKTPPACSVERPAKCLIQKGYFSTEAYNVCVKGEDRNGIANLLLFIDGKVVKEVRCRDRIEYSWRIHSVREGEHSIGVSACDTAGNQSRISKKVLVGNLARDWYFAEGNTLPDFEEYICIVNPSDKKADIEILFMLEDGSVISARRIVEGKKRETIRVKDYVPEGHHVSAQIRSPGQAIVAERPMYFRYKENWVGGHNCVGLNQLSKVYYFAEGTTRKDPLCGEFEEWICIMNPSETKTATVDVTYMTHTGKSIQKTYQVAPHSRHTIDVAGDVGLGMDVSAKINSNIPIAAERPMYFNYGNFAAGGSNVVGASAPSKEWYFSEGATHPGFHEWLCILNPNDKEAVVEIEYMTEAGRIKMNSKTIKPRSRFTVDVLNEVGDNLNVSAIVRSSLPVVAERSMYFICGINSEKEWNGGEAGVGAASLSSSYLFAEGCTLKNFETFYTVLNPENRECEVNIELMTESGQIAREHYAIAPHARMTVCLNDVLPGEVGVSAFIKSSHPVAVERPIYFIYGENITGGHGGCGYGID